MEENIEVIMIGVVKLDWIFLFEVVVDNFI